MVTMFIFSTSLSAQKGNMNGMKNNKSKYTYHQQNQFQRIPDITDSQKDQLKTLRTKMMKESLPIKNKLMEQKAHLNTLSTAENPDMKSINKQIELIGKSKTEMMKVKSNFRQEVRKILTEEQRVFFDTHKGHMKHKMKGMNCPK
jgi:Spy/CpxP family protein refolding chaperone